MKKNNFTVNYNQDGLRLFVVIADELSVSKKQSQFWIDSKLVLVNKKRVWIKKHIVNEGDFIEILSLNNTLKLPKKIPIVWQDSYYIIINKPPGLITNAAKNSIEESLRIQEGNLNIVAVHRLDKETSGCLIFAKSSKNKNKAIPLFKEKKIIKIYRAITIGKFPRIWKEIRTDISGYMATTLVKILDHNKIGSYLEVKIETGRTHQIRKHLAYKRYPVLGDKKYAGTGNNLSLEQPRHMLHAYCLIFNHPFTNERISVKAPIPSDFKKCLNQVKLS